MKISKVIFEQKKRNIRFTKINQLSRILFSNIILIKWIGARTELSLVEVCLMSPAIFFCRNSLQKNCIYIFNDMKDIFNVLLFSSVRWRIISLWNFVLITILRIPVGTYNDLVSKLNIFICNMLSINTAQFFIQAMCPLVALSEQLFNAQKGPVYS